MRFEEDRGARYLSTISAACLHGQLDVLVGVARCCQVSTGVDGREVPMAAMFRMWGGTSLIYPGVAQSW